VRKVHTLPPSRVTRVLAPIPTGFGEAGFTGGWWWTGGVLMLGSGLLVWKLG
jgi:hypothetical protein